jgi:hypothetical protein
MLDIYLQHTTVTHVRHLRTDRISKVQWPHQLPPASTSTFKLWVRYLTLCFLNVSGKKLRNH